MKIIYSSVHEKHHSNELSGGQLLKSAEKPERALNIIKHIEAVSLGDIIAAKEFSEDIFYTIHDKDYIQFLKSAYARWKAEGQKGAYAHPIVWPARGMVQRKPKDLYGQLGYYSHSVDCGIGEYTWEAAKWSGFVALTGQELISQGKEKAVFSLCRPPGHHAHSDLYGGFCYINNAALSCEAFIRDGFKRVAFLDIDYHHGNGSQQIFYAREDVFFASLHADPDLEYPNFLGYADEIGTGAGEGYNLNLPMPFGTNWSEYKLKLEQALERIRDYGPDIFVISLGVDTFEEDPISHFKLKSENYLEIGALIKSIDVPTHFVMEGGYASDAIGLNVANVLKGYENG